MYSEPSLKMTSRPCLVRFLTVIIYLPLCYLWGLDLEFTKIKANV
jgi:hypothetical protein